MQAEAIAAFAGVVPAHLENPARHTSATQDREYKPLFSKDDLSNSWSTICALPGYQATPLVSLHGLASVLKVERVKYKDEGHRFGLGSFKAVGGAYAVSQVLAGRSDVSSITVTSITDGNYGLSVAWGAKDALTAMIEEHFDKKTEEFPQHSRACKKGRDRILRAIRNRDTILPGMAVSEGWSEESVAFEIQVATNHMVFMIQQDLQSRESDTVLNRPISKFVVMLDNGKSRTIKGNSIGCFENNTTYRDRYDNVFSLPVSTPDVE